MIMNYEDLYTIIVSQDWFICRKIIDCQTCGYKQRWEKMKKVIIVQARMGSTRLPGKVLREVLGKPLLEYQLERLARVRSSDMVVVATTDKEQDKPIVDLCRRLGVLFSGGRKKMSWPATTWQPGNSGRRS